jgi:hypothetical protein
MNLTVEALKELYIALGGNATNVANITLIPDMIEAIAAHISGGGAAELPTVSIDDNGDVLTVVNDHWEAATPTAELPNVTVADNGKVLTVVGGEWSAAALPTS